MKDAWKDYFSFNRKQRNGIVILLLFIAILITYLFIADYFPSSSNPVNFTPFKAEIEKAGATHDGEFINTASAQAIDINSADTNVLITLPKMTSYCAGMIVRYRKNSADIIAQSN
jgi:hypothetical protein